MSGIAYMLIFGLLGGLMASVIYGLYWALRRGQFSDFARGATSIFDEEEPQGFRTDAFPDEREGHGERGERGGRGRRTGRART